MNRQSRKEQATMWHDCTFDNLEILHATYMRHVFTRHAHETFAIGLIEHGASEFFARGTTHTATASDIFIIHPDEIHDGRAIAPTGYTFRVLYPPLQLIQHLALESGHTAPQTPFFPQAVIKDRQLYNLLLTLHRLFSLPSDPLEREEMFSLACIHLLNTYALSCTQTRTHGREHAAVSLVQDYIHAHYDQSISLGQLSVLAQLHPAYLVRTFRAAIGVPPHAYLIHVRILAAKRLLLAGVAPGQIAVEAGFADQSHLTRHFKRLVGVPPAHYVQKKVKNVQDIGW